MGSSDASNENTESKADDCQKQPGEVLTYLIYSPSTVDQGVRDRVKLTHRNLGTFDDNANFKVEVWKA